MARNIEIKARLATLEAIEPRVAAIADESKLPALRDGLAAIGCGTIGRAGAGTNNIPVKAMSARGVPVFNAPGANANAVKELVIAGMLFIHKGGDPRLLPDLLLGHMPQEEEAPVALPEPKAAQEEAAENA